MQNRSMGLIFLGLILIVSFPTLNANLETAIAGGGLMVTALRFLVTFGVIGGAIFSLSMAAYEEFMR